MQIVDSLSQCPLIVLCGPQGSGKTLVYKLIKEFLACTRVDGKRLNQFQQIILARYALMSGNRVVVDCVNPSKTSRNMWIKLARDFGIAVGVLYLDIDREQAAERAVRREIEKGSTPEEAVSVVKELHSMFYAQLEVPNDDEGFDCNLIFNEAIGY